MTELALRDIEFLRKVAGLGHADADLTKGHGLLQLRWPKLDARLRKVGLECRIIEVYRPDARQQWLFGQGRTATELEAKGIDPRYARAGAIVTNAWSALTSAHGWTEGGKPAAAALDVDPVGVDGRPWTPDDPWDEMVSEVASCAAQSGLVHFMTQGKVRDKPHLQLVEWSDRLHSMTGIG